jgi:predicted anti-sigma-YlaC factor YlaD
MDCASTRAAISSFMDGEDPGVPRSEVDAHLERCRACQRWQKAAHTLTRQARLQPLRDRSTDSEALIEDLRRNFASERRPDTLGLLRGGLLLMGLFQIAATLPVFLVGGSDDVWDLLCVQVALGVGFLVCWRRPRRAHALVLMVGTAALLMTATAIVEIVRGRSAVLEESPHLITLVGWLLLWLTSRHLPPSLDAERLRSPVQLDKITRIRSRRGWLAHPQSGEGRSAFASGTAGGMAEAHLEGEHTGDRAGQRVREAR